MRNMRIVFSNLSFLVGPEHWIAGSSKSHGIQLGWLKYGVYGYWSGQTRPLSYIGIGLFLSLMLIFYYLQDFDCFKFTHFLGVIPVQEGCLTVAATGHGAVHGLQSVISPVILIHAPVRTALVESTMGIATEGKNSIEVIHAVQCPLDVDM
jgi:hypothetical protein